MNSFLSFGCPANRRACLLFATGYNCAAWHPCFYSGVVSLSRHKHEVGGRLSHTLEQIPEPRSHGRVRLSATQIRATAQFQDSQTEKSWCSKMHHAFPGQGDTDSPRDTTHPTQHKRVVSKRREKETQLFCIFHKRDPWFGNKQR